MRTLFIRLEPSDVQLDHDFNLITSLDLNVFHVTAWLQYFRTASLSFAFLSCKN